MSPCCDTCPMVPTCEEAESFNCDIGLHAWVEHTAGTNEWDECHLCGEVREATP